MQIFTSDVGLNIDIVIWLTRSNQIPNIYIIYTLVTAVHRYYLQHGNYSSYAQMPLYNVRVRMCYNTVEYSYKISLGTYHIKLSTQDRLTV
jgi:hypothetical protein